MQSKNQRPFGGNSMKSRIWLVTIVMIAALALSACGPAAPSATVNTAPAASASNLQPVAAVNPATVAKSSAAIGSISDLESTLEQIYQQVNPSVVAIQV